MKACVWTGGINGRAFKFDSVAEAKEFAKVLCGADGVTYYNGKGDNKMPDFVVAPISEVMGFYKVKISKYSAE